MDFRCVEGKVAIVTDAAIPVDSTLSAGNVSCTSSNHFLHHYFKKCFISNTNLLYSCSLLFVKVKAKQISSF